LRARSACGKVSVGKIREDVLAIEDEFAKEIAKQLPVKAAYEDAVRPAARQTGELAEDLVKVVRLALFPVQLLAAAQDRFRKFVKSAVDRVPFEKRIPPAPEIVGPILEGVRYEREGGSIEQMFSELFSSSMNSERVADAHPALPLIIKQLSADEAAILRAIASAPKYFEIVTRFDLQGGLALSKLEKSEVPTNGLDFPQNEGMYRDHLERLGLIRYDTLKPMQAIIANGQQTGGRNFLVLKLTEFGATLMRASGIPPIQPI
jgi:hypothetical protein